MSPHIIVLADTGDRALSERLTPADHESEHCNQQLVERGDYRWVAEVVNHLVFARPDNLEAKGLQARALEQLAYGAENGTWRNFSLIGAMSSATASPEPRHHSRSTSSSTSPTSSYSVCSRSGSTVRARRPADRDALAVHRHRRGTHPHPPARRSRPPARRIHGRRGCDRWRPNQARRTARSAGRAGPQLRRVSPDDRRAGRDPRNERFQAVSVARGAGGVDGWPRSNGGSSPRSLRGRPFLRLGGRSAAARGHLSRALAPRGQRAQR